MPIEANAIQYGPWRRGVNYSAPAEELVPDAMYDGQNVQVGPSGEAKKRKGFTKYISSALGGTPTLTATGDHRFSAASSSTFAIAGAVFYEDASGTWTDRTGGLTITAGDDNVFSTANAGGTLIATNGVTGDSLIKWAAAGGNIAALNVDARFTTAKYFAYWDTRAWAGNLSSGTDRVWRSDAGDIETWAATAFHTFDEDVTGVIGFRNLLAVHTENSIYGLFPTGNATTPYSVQRRADKGTIAHRSLVINAAGNMFFVRRDGIYEWQRDVVPQKISHELDDRYWPTINQNRLHMAFAVDYVDAEELWFFLPYGGSQTNNNHVMIFNYRNRNWYPPYIGFERNCGALIDDLPHAGGYSDGLLYIHDNGTNDNTAAIDAWFRTAAPPAVHAGVQTRWLYARHHFDVKGDHTVQVQQTAPGIVSSVEGFTMGGGYDAIETSFTIGTSQIANEDFLATEDTNLRGYDPGTQLQYRNANVDQDFVIRRVECMHRPTGLVRKERGGLE